MDFKIKDYTIFLSQNESDTKCEVLILRKDKLVTKTFTVSILNIGTTIKSVITKNEIREFGNIRFDLNNY